MGCGLNQPQKKMSLNTKLKDIFTDKEINILFLIFQDLSQRNAYRKIDYQNFRLFFRKNGLWTEQIFKQFDLNGEELLNQEQFLKGIARMYKSSEEQKAKLLFSHFASGCQRKGEEGLLYKDFLRMLYNYPKSDLQQILQDQYFFEEKVKKSLVSVKNSPYTTVSRVPQQQTVVFGLIQEGTQMESNADPQNQQERLKRTSSQLRQQFHSRQNKIFASLTFFLYNKNLNVKMTSIHALVKKYAEMIFNEFHMSTKTGRLKQNDFIQWVLKHKKLYQNFYNGFHEYIWSCKNGKPAYLDSSPEVSSPARMFQIKNGQQCSRKVQIMNIRGMLIVHEPNKKQQLIKIIYLQGLAVTPIKQKNFIGFKITHPTQIYKPKKFYLLNQILEKKWMQSLAYYKGKSVYADFILDKRIGTGKFSIVYECVEITTQKLFAMKQIQTYKLSQEAKAVLKNESQILSTLDHKNIPKFYKSYQSKTHIHIAMQLIKGTDLYQYIKRKGKISEFQAIPIVKQIIKGTKYFQKMGIIHRDIKPDNILLVPDSQSKAIKTVKIIDFGFATYLSNYKNSKHQLGHAVGTPNFIAPQMLEQKGQITLRCDNFSIGSVVYYILSGSLPFLAEDIYEVFQKTKKGDFNLENEPWDKISQEAKNFIRSLLKTNPEERMQLSDALQHPWLKSTIIEEQQYQKQSARKKISAKKANALIFDE